MRLAKFVLCATFLFALQSRADDALQLNPDNPHYFLFHGKATLLVGSSEHCGAVLNLDFDFQTYLDTLRNDNLNLVRIFSGTYREIPGSFHITDNTLAPLRGKFSCPFARSETPGNWDDGNKFDLTKFDPAYFDRLHDFLKAANDRNVVVEYTLFCTLYGDELWDASPFNSNNNINNVGRCDRRDVFTLHCNELTAAQDAFVKKVVAELADTPNVYFEICNEPYFENVTDEWQRHVAGLITSAERSHKFRHLIARNVANNRKKIESPDANVSIFNFHYATPPVTVGENWNLHRPIVDDETGFAGKDDATYRAEAWDFIMAGGGAFNHLDYSFTIKCPAGDLTSYESPGGGSPDLRHQLGRMKRFMEAFDFAAMSPHDELIKGGEVHTTLSPGSPARVKQLTTRLLAEPGKQYAAYVRGAGLNGLQIEMPPGDYDMTWIDPTTAGVRYFESFHHAGGLRMLPVPSYSRDLALKIISK